ncbi:uncharacterized protein LOC110464136 isoform X2 [Mizuhopecten yessoensis]|uniref:uncharacterized protein LOC110464136 isoform X2 n=1 Tax=Mizuhopecten yessoensis TaxID=6573 RepID=UPI000B458ABD|nr:uncharacterized protein LOC110464136 isoform X2 [Mizuhopecten yessoensis]
MAEPNRNEKKCGTTAAKVELGIRALTQETDHLTKNVTERPRKTKSGNPGPSKTEIIPKEIQDNIQMTKFNKGVITYALLKLKEKLGNIGNKHVNVVEITGGNVSISMISYSDALLEERNHDSSKKYFLCWILTGESQTLKAHCKLLTNIGCNEPNHVFLLDSHRSKNYELTEDVLNALGHLLQLELNSIVKVEVLNVLQQTYGQPLCFPYTYGWAIEILLGRVSTLEKIRFVESKIIEDLLGNLRSKCCHKQFTIKMDSDPDFSPKVIRFLVFTWNGLQLADEKLQSLHTSSSVTPVTDPPSEPEVPFDEQQPKWLVPSAPPPDHEEYYKQQRKWLEPSAPPPDHEEYNKDSSKLQTGGSKDRLFDEVEVDDDQLFGETKAAKNPQGTGHEKALGGVSSMGVTDTVMTEQQDPLSKSERDRDEVPNISEIEELQTPPSSASVTNAVGDEKLIPISSAKQASSRKTKVVFPKNHDENDGRIWLPLDPTKRVLVPKSSETSASSLKSTFAVNRKETTRENENNIAPTQARPM